VKSRSRRVALKLTRMTMYCAQCDNELIAPEWSEYRSAQQHLWRCWRCDYCFETIVNTKSMEQYIMTKHELVVA
jgi:RNase P subunit RPR2